MRIESIHIDYLRQSVPSHISPLPPTQSLLTSAAWFLSALKKPNTIPTATQQRYLRDLGVTEEPKSLLAASFLLHKLVILSNYSLGSFKLGDDIPGLHEVMVSSRSDFNHFLDSKKISK